MTEDTIIAIAGMITGISMVLGLPLVIVQARKLWMRDSAARVLQGSPETDLRLERIEAAIDAMAVEVERISEGQRFVTRLLSDRQEARAEVPSSVTRQQS